jgi:hypothetical protein
MLVRRTCLQRREGGVTQLKPYNGLRAGIPHDRCISTSIDNSIATWPVRSGNEPDIAATLTRYESRVYANLKAVNDFIEKISQPPERSLMNERIFRTVP